MFLFKKIVLLLIVIIVLTSSYILYGHNWDKLKFYMTNPQTIALDNIKLTWNYGMAYQKIDNSTDKGLIVSYMGEVGNGDIILITNATYSSANEIYDYYNNSIAQYESISYENINIDNTEAISVKYYVLPSREYTHAIFFISKNVVMGYTGPEKNEIRFKKLINSLKFIK